MFQKIDIKVTVHAVRLRHVQRTWCTVSLILNSANNASEQNVLSSNVDMLQVKVNWRVMLLVFVMCLKIK